jgi:hypothetical protein
VIPAITRFETFAFDRMASEIDNKCYLEGSIQVGPDGDKKYCFSETEKLHKNIR